MSARFLWETNDLLRRAHDGTREESGGPNVSTGERLEQAVRPFSGRANEPARGVWYPGIPDDVGSPPGLRRSFEHQREDVRGAGRLCPIARRLEDLARDLDQRQNEARESGRAAIKALVISMAPWRNGRQNQEPDRVLLERVERGALELDRKFAGAPYGRITSQNHERDELGSPADHFSISAFDPVQPPIPPAHGLAHQEEEFQAIEHLNSIMRRLDELACEVDEREGDATDAEIAAFKHRLTALAREIDQRPLPETGRDEADEYFNSCAGQLGPRASHTGDWGDFGGVGRCGLPAVPRDQRRNEAFAAGLSAINALVDSMAPRRDPHQSQVPVHALRERIETGALERDQQVFSVPEQWITGQDRERDQAQSPDDLIMISASDRVLPPISSADSAGPVNKRLPWSTIAPFAKAVLAAVLAITVVVAGTYFVRSRMPGASAATLVAGIFKQNAPAAEISSPRSLGIVPQNTFARFQEQVFQLPNLYGIYAINSDKLFELEALPGQVPDRRVPVSAVIPQPSRTTLPDGRIAFLVFRRDVATSISERVPIRIVAKIRRKMTINPTGERGSAGVEDAWTIRNIAFDFRVAPVEQNKEMVLLRPEDSGFTFPAGRYALILKGQAYDFTVAGAVTDPAQCLERVEAANGSFFHQCQQPEAGAAGPPLQKSTPPQRSRLSSKMPRRGELHAPAYD